MLKHGKWLAMVKLGLAGVALLLSHGRGLAQEKAKERPQVEVVFCLDTTGSMGGLINAAKQKIWAISNQIAGGNPTPQLKIGLVAYRDRSDAYVTKITQLTDDLDAVYADLMKFQAQGGGDFPESVNQALHESVTKINWSNGKNVLKIVFLVGDAPPKMDYKDDVKYQETCQLAAKSSIIINTIQCGGNAETKTAWQDICRLAEGSYVQIEANGGPIEVVATPFDKELAEINGKLASSTLAFGGEKMRRMAHEKADAATKLSAPAAAARAGFAGKSGNVAAYDLLDNIKSGKVKLESLKKDELPNELQKLTLAEQKAYLNKVEAERNELRKRAVELDRKRNDYIKEELAKKSKDAPANTFDSQVLRILSNQAQRINVRYAVEEKKKD